MPFSNDEWAVKIEDVIYEAAVNADAWPLALEKAADLSGSEGGALFVATENGTSWTASNAIRPTMQRFISDGWLSKNSRGANGFKKGFERYPCFQTEREIYDSDEYEHDPLYTEFLRPSGLGWFAGTAIALPHGDFMILSVERAHAKGQVSDQHVLQLNAIRPHLARSAMIAARFAFERMHTGVEVLNRLGLAAFALAGNGRVVLANRCFEAEKALWTTKSGDKIALLDTRADRIIYQTLSVIHSDTGIRSIPLFSLDGTERAILHIVPVRR